MLKIKRTTVRFSFIKCFNLNFKKEAHLGVCAFAWKCPVCWLTTEVNNHFWGRKKSCLKFWLKAFPQNASLTLTMEITMLSLSLKPLSREVFPENLDNLNISERIYVWQRRWDSFHQISFWVKYSTRKRLHANEMIQTEMIVTAFKLFIQTNFYTDGGAAGAGGITFICKQTYDVF